MHTLLVQSHAFIDAVARYARRDTIVYYPNSIRARADDPDADGRLPAELREALDAQLADVMVGAYPFLGARCERISDAVLQRLG